MKGKNTMKHTSHEQALLDGLRYKAEDDLTAVEVETIMLSADGMSEAQIADKIDLTVPTVRARLRSAQRKFGTHTRAELLAAYLRGDPTLEQKRKLAKP